MAAAPRKGLWSAAAGKAACSFERWEFLIKGLDGRACTGFTE